MGHKNVYKLDMYHLAAKISLSLAFGAATLVPFLLVTSMVNQQDLYFSMSVSILVLFVGYLFNSIPAAIAVSILSIWTLLMYYLIENFDQFVFWRAAFLNSSLQFALVYAGAGSAVGLAILLFLSFKRINFAALEKGIGKVFRNKKTIPILIFLSVIPIISPLIFLPVRSISVLQFLSTISVRKIDTRTRNYLRISPEQTVEYFLTALEKGDYESAYFAQTKDSVFNESQYYDFIDRMKEEEIQFSKPVNHSVEQSKGGQGASDGKIFAVTVTREDTLVHHYNISVLSNNGTWYIEDVTLVRID